MISITDKEFYQLTEYIKEKYGIQLKEEKRVLVTGRLHHVLLQNNFDSFTQYFKHLATDKTGEAAKVLIDKITTNHTFFMREAEHFYYLRDKILPNLESSCRNKDLRIWSAGCSTGEEPSTLAMVIDEFFGSQKNLWDAKVLATDISGRVLDIAQKGIYSSESLANIPPHWKINYFKKINESQSILADKIRKEIIYRKFNLTDENYPFKRKFHAIFCRNVMIYFDNKTRDEIVERFYDMTEPGGYLFIGHSESLKRQDTRYQYIMPAVYRKE